MSEIEIRKCCGTCYFMTWLFTPTPVWCRRYPPTESSQEDDFAPCVCNVQVDRQYGWCGEYRQEANPEMLERELEILSGCVEDQTTTPKEK